MTQRRSTSSSGPRSRGARVLPRKQLLTFFNDAFWTTEQDGSLGALLLIHVQDGDRVLDPEEMEHASNLIAQLARQADAVGVVEEGTIAVVLRAVQRRGDTHVMMDRIKDVVGSSAFGWSLSVGMSVFPLSGPEPHDAWSAAKIDLQGARSHDCWEHIIPCDTVRTHTAPEGSIL